jgi:hypothetical protein
LALQFQTELKPAHVKEATAGLFRRQITKPAVLLGVLALFAAVQALFWFLAPVFGAWWHAALAFLMALSIGGSVYFAGLYYEAVALRNFERFQGAPVRVSLEEACYSYEAPWGRGRIEWSRFQSLWCLGTVWVLLQHVEGGASVLLPSQDLDEEARAFLRARMARERAQVLD